MNDDAEPIKIRKLMFACSRCDAAREAADVGQIFSEARGARWYCHGLDDTSPTCYELATLDALPDDYCVGRAWLMER